MIGEPGSDGRRVWRAVVLLLTALALSLLVGAFLLWPYIFWLLPGMWGVVVAVAATIVVGFICLLLYCGFDAWRLRRSAWRKR